MLHAPLRSLANGTPPADAATPSSLRLRSASALRHGSHCGPHHRRSTPSTRLHRPSVCHVICKAHHPPPAPSNPLNRATADSLPPMEWTLRFRRTYGHSAPLQLHCDSATPTARSGCNPHPHKRLIAHTSLRSCLPPSRKGSYGAAMPSSSLTRNRFKPRWHRTRDSAHNVMLFEIPRRIPRERFTYIA
jgi:hypothetical protein